ncbi:hypothetical protein C8Q76DRAFT_467703 [Earliella scabrosa]|nr:hypothetical protein C8Q76DRAFT_467703 [Earliella scabrosa]
MPQKIVDRIINATTERELAEAWAAWLNPTTKNANGPCPGYRLGLSQDRWDPGDAERSKVDGGFYVESELPDDGRPHLEAIRALLEFKSKAVGHLDPYDDKIEDDGASETRQDVRGQVTHYVAHSFACQHRTAVFLFLITGRKIRVTRWDRSETIFTESFDYIDDRTRLRDLLYGFSPLSREEQGFDSTATPLTEDDDDFAKMDKVALPCAADVSEVEGTLVSAESKGPYTLVFTRDSWRTSIQDPSCRYRLSVPTPNGDRFFLVGKPLFVAPGMSGRGTRGFIAWDVSGDRFVFLKDAWRPCYENVDTEGKVLRELRAAGVPNIPTTVCDGELDQVTAAHFHASRLVTKPAILEPRGEKRKADNPQGVADENEQDHPVCEQNSPDASVNRGKNLIRPVRHYRIVMEEVCLPLCDFKTGRQFVSILRDCVQAHAGAVESAKIIHRDISAGNMLICPTVVRDEDGVLRVLWKGILADWELSKPLTEVDHHKARQPVRTALGTWQFASAHILDNPDEPVRIADELESFFHVTLYNGLRYLRHSCQELQMVMFDYFDQYQFRDRSCCGVDKRTAMRFGELRGARSERYAFKGDQDVPKHPLNTIMAAMLLWFQARYANLLPKDDDPAISDEIRELDMEEGVTNGSCNEESTDDLDSHDALLKLLDTQLQQPWPKNDKVGD